jgi:hypothetical protein
MIEWFVLQLSPPSYPAALTTPSQRRFLAALITVSHCQIEFPGIPHEFRVDGIQLVLISGVSFYFVDRKGEIIEVMSIQ